MNNVISRKRNKLSKVRSETNNLMFRSGLLQCEVKTNALTFKKIFSSTAAVPDQRCWSAWDRFCFKCWIIKSVSSVVNEIFCRRALVVKVIRNVIISLEDDGFPDSWNSLRKQVFLEIMFWKAGFWEKKFKSMKETPLIEKYLKIL